MSEDVSRRKALSLLGLGAALGFTLSAALEPLEAEAQEAAAPPPRPLRQPGPTGCNDGQRGGRGRHERRHGRHERRHERRTGEKPAAAPAAHLRRNSGSVCSQPPVARFDELGRAYASADHAMRETADERKGGSESTRVPGTRANV